MWRRCPNLAEEDGHEVVVDEEGLREVWVVKVEEERGEAQRDVLLRWGAEGRAQQLHACHGDEQSSAAGWGGGENIVIDIYRTPCRG